MIRGAAAAAAARLGSPGRQPPQCQAVNTAWQPSLTSSHSSSLLLLLPVRSTMAAAPAAEAAAAVPAPAPAPAPGPCSGELPPLLPPELPPEALLPPEPLPGSLSVPPEAARLPLRAAAALVRTNGLAAAREGRAGWRRLAAVGMTPGWLLLAACCDRPELLRGSGGSGRTRGPPDAAQGRPPWVPPPCKEGWEPFTGASCCASPSDSPESNSSSSVWAAASACWAAGRSCCGRGRAAGRGGTNARAAADLQGSGSARQVFLGQACRLVY